MITIMIRWLDAADILTLSTDAYLHKHQQFLGEMYYNDTTRKYKSKMLIKMKNLI